MNFEVELSIVQLIEMLIFQTVYVIMIDVKLTPSGFDCLPV